jgi:FtsZ-binding cell division protein ZapB
LQIGKIVPVALAKIEGLKQENQEMHVIARAMQDRLEELESQNEELRSENNDLNAGLARIQVL